MKQLFAIFIGLFLGLTLQAQTTIGSHKIKRANKIVWFGLDFTGLQCVGRKGFNDTHDIAERIVFAWNDLFIEEHDKYAVNEALKKDAFYYDLDSSEKQNEKVDENELIVEKAEAMSRDDIAAIVENYSSEEHDSGLGMIFIVEELNKTDDYANINVVVFDIESKEIIKAVKYAGEPGGYGFRNYWAGAFHEIIQLMERDYHKWYKKNKK